MNVTKWKNKIYKFFAAVIILIAVIVSVTRLITPLLNQHRDTFEHIAASILQRPVSITAVSVRWFGYTPHLTLQGVVVADPNTHKSILAMQQLDISFNLWRSLLTKHLQIKSLGVSGINLLIDEEPNGNIKLGQLGSFNMHDDSTGSSLQLSVIRQWIFSQARLTLQNISLHYVQLNQKEISITLRSLDFYNDENEHAIRGSAIINQHRSTIADINAHWFGDIENVQQNKLLIFLKIHHLNLSQWFLNPHAKQTTDSDSNNFYTTLLSLVGKSNQNSPTQTAHTEALQGEANADIWLRWLANKTWQLQSKFDFTNLDLISAKLNNWFEKPLHFNSVKGNLALTCDMLQNCVLQTDDLRLVNSDLSLVSKFNLYIPHDKPMSIDLTGKIDHVSATKVANYLPLKIFDKPLHEWLRNAFLSGYARDAQVQLKGPLDAFPFDHAEGQFTIKTQLDKVKLKFSEAWPAIENIDGELIFNNRSMFTKINTAAMLDLRLEHIDAQILSLGGTTPAKLTVHGQVNTDTSHARDFIFHTPLAKSIGNELKFVDLTGNVGLDLSLTIPLTQVDNYSLLGKLDLQNVLLKARDFPIEIQTLHGLVNFTENTISAPAITGKLFDIPITIQIATNLADKNITACTKVEISTDTFNKLFHINVAKFATGRTTVQTQLIFPLNNSAPMLQLTSDLVGINLLLPDVYAKQANDIRPSNVTLYLNDADNLKLRLQYATLINATVLLKNSSTGAKINGVNVFLGDKNIDWPTDPLFNISGLIPSVDWSNWQKYFSAGNSSFNLPLVFDLSVNDFKLPNYVLHGMRIIGKYSLANLTMNLTSKELAGDIIIAPHAPWDIHCKYLYLPSTPQSTNSFDLRTLPELNFKCDNFYINKEKNIGSLQFMTHNSPQDVLIDKIELHSALLNANGTINWSPQHTHLQSHLTTHKLSSLLKDWGVKTDDLVASQAEATLNLSWPKLFTPTLTDLAGKISFELGEGRIIGLSNTSSAQMGLGRMLNVFSLKTLPRRLSLDFSDMFESGYSFDLFKATFALQNGNATTQDMKIDGPIARIHISGRIGLIKKDFDLKLHVTPYVTSSLPVVAALAGGPVVGIATWVVDRVISRAVSRATRYTYTVVGPWEKPIWTKLGEDKASVRGRNDMNKSKPQH